MNSTSDINKGIVNVLNLIISYLESTYMNYTRYQFSLKLGTLSDLCRWLHKWHKWQKYISQHEIYSNLSKIIYFATKYCFKSFTYILMFPILWKCIFATCTICAASGTNLAMFVTHLKIVQFL